jgi:serine/threonine-protein kinase RsbW
VVDSGGVNRLCVPAVLDRLRELQTFVQEKAQQSGLSAETCTKLELVMEELVVNIIHYAYPDIQGEVEAHCELEKKEVQHCFCVTLRDWGTPFNPLKCEMPNTELDIDDRPIGGLGILLAEKMADSMRYTRKDDCNLLRFCFDIPDTGVGRW